jgi:polyhydroxybutyrate depolymerase
LISCGKSESTKNPKTTNRLSDTITIENNVRNYIAHVPRDAEEAEPHPLVFVLHGGRGSPANMEEISNFHNQQSQGEFITVYPAAAGKFWNDGRANANAGINDIKFINNLVDTLQNKYAVAEDSIFATGLSNGGTMSVRLGCESQQIKGMSAVASTAVKRIIDNCSPDTPKPLMIIQGTEDPITNFNGVQRRKRKIVSHDYAIQKFVSLNNCNDQFSNLAIPDTSDDETSTIIRRYGDCERDAKVVSVVVKNGGHTWPGGSQYRSRFLVGKTSQDFNASEIIWTFFNSQIQ